MNHLREELVFLHEAISCLTYANSIIIEINQATIENNTIRKAAIERAIIEYAKPFKSSNGIFKKHRLDKNIVPQDCLEIHEKIIQMRDQVLAHSDLKIKEPNISKKTYGKTTVTTTMKYHINPIEEIGGEIKIKETINSVLSVLHNKAINHDKKI